MPENAKIVFTLFILQGLTALTVSLILRRFFLTYKSHYFQYWYWSWLAAILVAFGSAVALINAMTLPGSSNFRTIVSTFVITSSLIQYFWLFAGSYELTYSKKIEKKRFLIFTFLAVPIAFLLVILYKEGPSYIPERLFLRIGLKSLIGCFAFVASAVVIFRLRSRGIGIKLLIIAFALYGIELMNYFAIRLYSLLDIPYPVDIPFYTGAVDLFILSLMGLGMVMSMLEVERYQLQKVNNELDTFLYRSSHDLRSPLSTIAGIVDYLKSTEDKEEHTKFLHMIEDRLSKTDNVIRDIITLRKNQKSGLNVAHIDPRKEIEGCFNSFVNPQKKNPRLELISPEKTSLYTDVSRFNTIFENILSNTFKYHNYDQESVFVRVTLSPIERGLSVTIEDNGQGIPKKHLGKIFDMFYRANNKSEGTGLGLYLVKDAIDYLGGNVSVESIPSEGTTFRLFIPNLETKN